MLLILTNVYVQVFGNKMYYIIDDMYWLSVTSIYTRDALQSEDGGD